MDEVQKAAKDAWDRVEAAQRFMWTRMRLMNLSKLAELLDPNDRIDAARGIWLEYIDGRTALDRFADNLPEKRDGAELAEQAHVLSEIARYLPGAHVIDFAAKAWGAHEFDLHVSRDLHVGWEPFDRALTLIRGNLVEVVTEPVGAL